jgi:hypothetical protein
LLTDNPDAEIVDLDALREHKLGEFPWTAVSEFAFRGEFGVVNRLLALGSSLNFAAYGAARGGHQEYADALIERGAKISWVALGAGQGGHQAYADALIERGANIDYVAEGAAEGGHLVYADAMIARGASILWVAQGAGRGGHQAYAEALIERGADISRVALGAGCGNHQAHADALIERGADINWVAQGAGYGGHQAYADALIERGADISYVALGAGYGGHQAYADALIERGADITCVARGAASGGYHVYASKLKRLRDTGALRLVELKTLPFTIDEALLKETLSPGECFWLLSLSACSRSTRLPLSILQTVSSFLLPAEIDKKRVQSLQVKLQLHWLYTSLNQFIKSQESLIALFDEKSVTVTKRLREEVIKKGKNVSAVQKTLGDQTAKESDLDETKPAVQTYLAMRHFHNTIFGVSRRADSGNATSNVSVRPLGKYTTFDVRGGAGGPGSDHPGSTNEERCAIQ